MSRLILALMTGKVIEPPELNRLAIEMVAEIAGISSSEIGYNKPERALSSSEAEEEEVVKRMPDIVARYDAIMAPLFAKGWSASSQNG